MKKLFSTLALAIGFCSLAQAQLVISEIMFNPPEAGADSLEFIEIYNASSSAIDLNGHYIVFGNAIRDTFNGSLMLPAGGLIITTVNDSASFNQYGLTVYPRQWRSNAGLGNNGSTVRLHNASGTVVDSVAYLAAWQTQAAGNGSSIILCNTAADNNLAANWSFSNTSTGNTINGKLLKASPNVLETCPVVNYPVYTISQIRGLNASGAADSLNVYCELRAIVHSEDFRGGAGYDFAFINSNNIGIAVVGTTNVSNYNVMRGDSLHIRGILSQFAGNLQFTPDSILVGASAQTLVTPMTVTAIVESNENQLIKLMNVVLVDTVNATPAGVTIRVRNATDTFSIRIDNDINAFGATLTSDSFNITGVGRQADFTSPFDSAYQLQPRNLADFEFLGAPVAVNRLENTNAVQLFPNPAQNLIFVQSEIRIESIIVSNSIGQVVAQQQNINQNNSEVSLADLPAGLYQATIRTENGSQTMRFVVAK
jgi:hypothetical protein